LKRFYVITAVLLSTVFAGLVGYFAFEYDDFNGPLTGAFLFGFMTFVVVGGITYLVYYTKCVNALDLPENELESDEILWGKNGQSMVHYKTGNAYKFWEAVGGKLYLTNKRLEFRAHGGQPWVYRLTIPLQEIRKATPVYILAIVPGALRIERIDGTTELFTFGATFDVSLEWANAIIAFRDDSGS
jgi:hypothetical protein